DYLGEAAFMDLHDIEHNTRDGLHIASLAGSWLALVAGFGGFRDHDGELTFAPRRPPEVTRLAFRLTVRGRRLHVAVDDAGVTYTLEEGDELALAHFGEALTVRCGTPEVRDVPAPPRHERPTQPAGREPRQRVRSAEPK
ncbi:MAG TPA: glycosyl hydrolase family 65 protein, partial [Baekduia sp.]|nr:glycosyl hydrolase family 65 protein [Baekduia sp.]